MHSLAGTMQLNGDKGGGTPSSPHPSDGASLPLQRQLHRSGLEIPEFRPQAGHYTMQKSGFAEITKRVSACPHTEGVTKLPAESSPVVSAGGETGL
jgi:hypothetical protein